MTTSTKAAMTEITNTHGHAGPVLHLAASLGWNARWESGAKQARISEAVRLLTAAGELLVQLEAEEQVEREELVQV